MSLCHRLSLSTGISVLLVLAGMTCSSLPDYLPEEIGDYQLYRKLTGEEARAAVNRIHLSPVSPEKNEIGFYRGPADEITLYRSVYPDLPEAKKAYHQMTQKISPANSVFIQGQFMKIAGREIYRCFGMGQTHYIFQHDRSLIWFSVNTIRSRELLDEYLGNIDQSGW